jgi:hypothetical protein
MIFSWDCYLYEGALAECVLALQSMALMQKPNCGLERVMLLLWLRSFPAIAGNESTRFSSSIKE